MQHAHTPRHALQLHYADPRYNDLVSLLVAFACVFGAAVLYVVFLMAELTVPAGI
jgi:hypothetical protein